MFSRYVAPSIVVVGSLMVSALAIGAPIIAQQVEQQTESAVIPTGADEYKSIAAIIANTGFLLWFAWYTVTKTMPKQQKEFGDQLEKERVLFQKILDTKQAQSDKHLELFLGELRAERESRSKLADAIDTLCDKIHAME